MAFSMQFKTFPNCELVIFGRLGIRNETFSCKKFAVTTEELRVCSVDIEAQHNGWWQLWSIPLRMFSLSSKLRESYFYLKQQSDLVTSPRSLHFILHFLHYKDSNWLLPTPSYSASFIRGLLPQCSVNWAESAGIYRAERGVLGSHSTWRIFSPCFATEAVRSNIKFWLGLTFRDYQLSSGSAVLVKISKQLIFY